MADVLAMLTCMKLSADAAAEITSATGHRILTIVNFSEMDKEGFDLVFFQLARPGGADAAAVRNPGIKFSAIGQQTFGLMYYYIKHKLCWVDWAVTFVSVTLPAVKSLKAQELLERDHKDPITVPGIDFKNWPKTMDDIEQWIKGYRAVEGSLLGYVTRKTINLFPEAAAADPAMGDADSTYMSHEDGS